jgi:hypothetical protein
MPPVGKNPNMARDGKENPQWKGGKSSDYRRKLMNAKPGEIVHHKDKNKKNNKKKNFQVLKPKNGMTAIGVHNGSHPEKGEKRWK